MGGVDALVALSIVLQNWDKIKKYYHRFFHLVDVAVVN